MEDPIPPLDLVSSPLVYLHGDWLNESVNTKFKLKVYDIKSVSGNAGDASSLGEPMVGYKYVKIMYQLN